MTFRNIIRLLVICSTMAVLPGRPTLLAAEKKIGQVTFFIGAPGDVLIRRRNESKWQNVQLKMDVLNADLIRTQKESRCEITLLDKSVVRVGELTEFELTNATLSSHNKKVKAVLSRGKVWSNVTKLKSQRDDFEIKTPTAVCAVRGTIYRIDADSSSTFLVYDGDVDVGPAIFWTMPQGGANRVGPPKEVPGPTEVPAPFEVTLEEWVRIVSGFQIIVRPDGKYAKSRINVASDNQLEWVQWNKQRDLQLINQR